MPMRRLTLSAFIVSLLFVGSCHSLHAQNSSLSSASRSSISPRRAHGFLRGMGARRRGLTPRLPGRILRNAASNVQASTSKYFEGATIGKRATTAPLLLKYSGFSTQQQADFTAFFDRALPLMVKLYGEPAPEQRGKSLRINNRRDDGDGVYAPPQKVADGAGTIGFAPYTAADVTVEDSSCTASCAESRAPEISKYKLARQVLLAFHGARVFDFDAWERGFADAAALIVYWQSKGSPKSFDPSYVAINSYLLPAYDYFNRPNLGAREFYSIDPQTNTPTSSLNLGDFRSTMAQAAWLKVWIENPNFFLRFNENYYSRYSPFLRGDEGSLITIAASIVPSVEGTNFVDWKNRQRVLDTALSPGLKLYVAASPLRDEVTGSDRRSAIEGAAILYRTNADGTETVGTASGIVTASDERNTDITDKSDELKGGARLSFDEDGFASFIIGFSDTGAPEQGRFLIEISAGGATQNAPFAYGVAGTVAKSNGFYGVTVGADVGTLKVESAGKTSTSSIRRGAFGAPITYPSSAQVKSTFTLLPNDGGAAKTFRRNSAWASFEGAPTALGVILDSPSSESTLPVAWNRSGSNVWRLISLPLQPTESDAAAALSLDRRTLGLARYRPLADGADFRALSFGIDNARHDFYPRIADALSPSRGYWLQVPTNLSRSVRGVEPSRAVAFETPLSTGWNSVGVPWNMAFALNGIGVRSGAAAPISWPAAIKAGLVVPGVWRWKTEGGYARVDNTSNPILSPLDGYFIYTARDVTLIWNVAARNGAQTPLAPPSPTNWQISLGVSAASGRMDGAAFGVASDAKGQALRVPAALPPEGPRALTLAFVDGGTPAFNALGAGRESGWSESLRANFTSATEWKFVVDGATSGETVRLDWSDVAVAPSGVNLMLVDDAAKISVPMKVADNARFYSWVAGKTARQFRVVATRLSDLKLSVRSLSPSRAALIAFAAPPEGNGTANVSIELPNGVVVRHLASDMAMTARQVGRWTWDGRGDRGHVVTGANFIARVRWQDADGSVREVTQSFSLPASL